MPIMLSVDQIEPGMCLRGAVRNRYSVLLPAGHVLTERDITSLQRRCPGKLIQVADPVLDGSVEFGDTGRDEAVSAEVRRSISGVARHVSQQVRSGTALQGEHLAGLGRRVADVMEYFEHNPVAMACVEQVHHWDNYLQEHAANVFYLSLVIGNSIRNYIKRERERLTAARSVNNALDLSPLATAALLHDLGMAPLEHLYRQAEPLTDEQRQQVRRHPVEGAALLPGTIHPMIRLVVRSHHENQQATGYPEQLPPNRITIFARILRVADAYSAALAATAFRPARSPIAVLHEMLHSPYRKLYDPVVLKVFAGVVQPLPVGAKLRLESGQTAVVTRHDPHDPFRPEVVVAFDKKGDYLPRWQMLGPLPLGSRADLRVASFAGEDISFINALPAGGEDEATDPAGLTAAVAAVAAGSADDVAALFYP